MELLDSLGVNVEVILKGDLTQMSKIRTYLDKEAKKLKKKDKIVNDELPIAPPSDNQYNINVKFEKKKKDKRIRKSSDMIKREVLDHFKEHPEWKLKDLAKLIDQDPKFVQPVVAQIAEFDQKTKTYHLREDLA